MKKVLTLIFTIACSTAFAQWQGSSTVQYFNGGNVGIGTAAPSGVLHTVGVGASSWVYMNGNLNGSTTIANLPGLAFGWNRSGGGGESIMTYNTSQGGASRLDFCSYNGSTFAQEMTLSGGKLGIGTNTPLENLHVKGTIRIQGSDAVIHTQNNAGGIQDLIGTYQGWNANVVYIAGYNNQNLSASRATTAVAIGGYLNERLYIDLLAGNVGIGTTTPGSFKLAVEGKIGAREVNVTTTTPWPDYVFGKNYSVPSLQQVKNYIEQNKHLPEIPSAAEIEKNGQNLGEMNMLLLKKIEELTLHAIQQQEQINLMKKRIEGLENNR